MAALRTEEVADAFARIAVAVSESMSDTPPPAMLGLHIACILGDFFEDKSDRFCDEYDRRMLELRHERGLD